MKKGYIQEYIQFIGIGYVCPHCNNKIEDVPQLVEEPKVIECTCGESFIVDGSDIEEVSV